MPIIKSPHIEFSTRWLARLGSLLSVGLLAAFFFGANEPIQVPVFPELLGFLMFPIGVVIGMVVAWKAELPGGAITVVSLIGFYVWHIFVASKFPGGPYFFLFALPGVLFFALGIASLKGGSRRKAGA